MNSDSSYIIKSFKHDGHLHRMWLENWLVPESLLLPEHAAEKMVILVNHQTPIQEADGRMWISKIPSVAFFLPGCWYNVIALMEESGVRYYCNIASPPYLVDHDRVLTYIDYDLDVIRTASGEVQIVDQEEYEQHRRSYHYSSVVTEKVEAGLNELLQRIDAPNSVFSDDRVFAYYQLWKNKQAEV